MTSPASEDLVLLIGSLDGKMDLLLASSTDHTARIGKLEKDRTRLAGAFLGLSAGFAWFAHDKLPALLALLPSDLRHIFHLDRVIC